MTLSPHQLEQADIATSGRICILTGGPGVGKTFVAASITSDAVASHGVDQVRVCAPTGKAAVRITEALQACGLPGVASLQATTIHRMLGVSRDGHDGDGWGFHHNSGNPLPARVVVVDEGSMLGTDLAASMFSALSSTTKVLLIGDEGQLPPVGHGAPLRDMIAAGLPCGRLTEVWRNEGDIVKACCDIRGGREWKPSPVIDIEEGLNLAHIETTTATATRDRLKALMEQMPKNYDPIADCQILCAVNENSPLSRIELNKGLQNILNPAGERDKSHDFRVGDKVMCLRNQFLRLIDEGEEKATEEQEFVANGDMGRVLSVGPGKMTVLFESPERLCYVAGAVLTNDVAIAYAVTVHKSQGSQWPIVIYVSDDARGARYVASRELIYTAISRAETLAITLGCKATIDRDCRREVLSGRKTFLVEQLQSQEATT